MKKTVHLSIDEELLAYVDGFAKDTKRTRIAVVEMALVDWIKGRDEPIDPEAEEIPPHERPRPAPAPPAPPVVRSATETPKERVQREAEEARSKRLERNTVSPNFRKGS